MNRWIATVLCSFVAFMAGTFFGFVIARSNASPPVAVEKAEPPIVRPPEVVPKAPQGIVEFSASHAPKDDTTREASALALLHSGTLADWQNETKDTRALTCIYYAARFTSQDDSVDTLARARTLSKFLDDADVSTKDRIGHVLVLFQTLHDRGNDFAPRVLTDGK